MPRKKGGKQKGGRGSGKGKKAVAKPGLRFEKRAARAVAQVFPELNVEHNQRLLTEPGLKRQFDVVGRVGGALTHTFEARERTRKIDVEHVDGFETKNSTLVEKPKVAGIISSKGFWESPLTWVRHYGDTKFVQQLYELRTSVPEDWDGDIRQVQIQADTRSIKTKHIRLVFVDETTGGVEVTRNATRVEAFVTDRNGRIVANLLDLLNREMQDTQKNGSLDTRLILLPPGSRVSFAGAAREVRGLEVSFEEVAIPAVALVDHSGRFPDTLINAVTGERWLIEDQTRALRASQNGFDLTLAFTDPDDPMTVDIDDLAAAPSVADVPKNVAEQIAARLLHMSIGVLRAGDRGDDPPEELTQQLKDASSHLASDQFDEAERVFKLTLERATALAALCGLAFIASKRGNHHAAANYSFRAMQMFPLEPQGFVNLVASLLAMNRLEEARAVVERARALHGVSFPMRRQEADLLYREARYEEAAELFYELSLDVPADASLVANLARCEKALGHDAAAAWDACRASALRPSDPLLAELAMKYAEGANDSLSVLDVIERCAKHCDAIPQGLLQRAVNASMSLDQPEAVMTWLERIPRERWGAFELATSGQVRMRTHGAAAGLDALRAAAAFADAGTEIQLIYAECALRASKPDETLKALRQCTTAEAARLRAFAHAMQGNDDALIAEVNRLDGDDANRLMLDAIAYVPPTAFTSLKQITEWILARSSADGRVLTQQAVMLASAASERPSAATIERAEEALRRAAEFGDDSTEFRVAQLLVATAKRDESAMTSLVAQLSSKTNPDLLGLCAHFAFGYGITTCAAKLADLFLSSTPSRIMDRGRVITIRIISACVDGEPQEVIERASSHGDLSSDAQGQLAQAVVSYCRRDVSRCLEQLQRLTSGSTIFSEAVLLKAQALAEAGAWAPLVSLAREFMPNVEPLVVWAARRAAGRAPVGMLPLAAATLVPNVAEIGAIAETGRVMRTSRGKDWADALAVAHANAPDATKVWVARFAHPTEFLRHIFRSTMPRSQGSQ